MRNTQPEQMSSGLPPEADIDRGAQHVSNVPHNALRTRDEQTDATLSAHGVEPTSFELALNSFMRLDRETVGRKACFGAGLCPVCPGQRPNGGHPRMIAWCQEANHALQRMILRRSPKARRSPMRAAWNARHGWPTSAESLPAEPVDTYPGGRTVADRVGGLP